MHDKKINTWKILKYVLQYIFSGYVRNSSVSIRKNVHRLFTTQSYDSERANNDIIMGLCHRDQTDRLMMFDRC